MKNIPSHRKIARRVGVSPQAVGKWFSGKSRPTLENAILLSHALDMTMGQVVQLIRKREVPGYAQPVGGK